MPSSQAQGWPLFMHGFHAWSGHETAPFMPLSLRPLGESCLRLHRFHAWSRPWDSTVSCLDLRPSVMRQHRFMPSSQTVKDHPLSCHEIAPFHAYISGIQGSNLSCTISHLSMPWDCTVHVSLSGSGMTPFHARFSCLIRPWDSTVHASLSQASGWILSKTAPFSCLIKALR